MGWVRTNIQDFMSGIIGRLIRSPEIGSLPIVMAALHPMSAAVGTVKGRKGGCVDHHGKLYECGDMYIVNPIFNHWNLAPLFSTRDFHKDGPIVEASTNELIEKDLKRKGTF